MTEKARERKKKSERKREKVGGGGGLERERRDKCQKIKGERGLWRKG